MVQRLKRKKLLVRCKMDMNIKKWIPQEIIENNEILLESENESENESDE